jgi:AraC-like DNA-binding protein
MVNLIDLSQAGILCGFLSIYLLLLRKNAVRTYSDYLLALFIFLQCWTAIAYILVFNGNIFQVPHFFKTAAPINLLIPPLGYLYVRSVLNNEKKFNYRDLIHFILFVFITIGYLPFFIMKTESKLAVIQAILIDKNLLLNRSLGFIPEPIFHFIRLLQHVFYLIIQWILILGYLKQSKDKGTASKIPQVIHWLKIFTGSNMFIFIAFIIVGILLYLQFDIFDEKINLLPNLIIGASFLFICTYLLIHPQVLIGLPYYKPMGPVSDINFKDFKKPVFLLETYTQEIEILEAYFESSKAYLQQNLSVSQVAVATGISSRNLSYLINTYHNKRFNDFLNERRLRHFINEVRGTSIDALTIEAIALNSGFSSKSAFYRSFKKFYGCTPLDFLKKTNEEI